MAEPLVGLQSSGKGLGRLWRAIDDNERLLKCRATGQVFFDGWEGVSPRLDDQPAENLQID